MPAVSRPVAPVGARRRSATRCLVSAAAFTVLSAPAPVWAQCSSPDPSIGGARWCIADIPYYWGPGLHVNTPATIPWRAAVSAAVTEINALGAIDLATPLFLYLAGTVGPDDPTPATGIVFQLFDDGAPSCSGETESRIGVTFLGLEDNGTGALGAITGAGVVFNAGARAAGYDTGTIVRHELCHALGVGHAGGTNCLMSPTVSCGQSRTLDASATQALVCLYGDNFGDTCAPNYGLNVESGDGETYDFRVGVCNCGGGGCGKSAPPMADASAPQALTYEFAISESGGPYMVFATPLEGDLVAGVFTHTFTQPYSSGLVRLRVLNGATTIDTAFASYPITVQPATAAPGAVAPQPTLAVQNAPNPFTSGTELSFSLSQAQPVAVTIYDAAGRRVAALHEGVLGAGPHRFTWSGRADDGSPASSGIYRCRITTGGSSTTRTLVMIR